MAQLRLGSHPQPVRDPFQGHRRVPPHSLRHHAPRRSPQKTPSPPPPLPFLRFILPPSQFHPSLKLPPPGRAVFNHSHLSKHTVHPQPAGPPTGPFHILPA